MKPKRAYFKDLLSGLHDCTRVMTYSRRGESSTASYFDVIYVNSKQGEVVLEQGEKFVLNKTEFDSKRYFWSDEFET